LNPSATIETPPAYGFTLTAGTLVIRLGYRVAGNTVTLFATTQVGTAPPTMWRQFETPKQSAVGAACRLAQDVHEYAAATGGLIRPSEDLDLDDFIEHLSLTINGELN
jgi:hypothetical protein